MCARIVGSRTASPFLSIAQCQEHVVAHVLGKGLSPALVILLSRFRTS